jgi:16S rRNA (cytosine967-C5)-methyltransferase
MDVREAAYLSLLRCESGGKYSNLEVDSAIKKYGFSGHDRALFTALVYGVIEKQITLDYLLAKLSSTPWEKVESKVKHLLRLGSYQILFLDRIPDSAACNETVELAKAHTHKGTSGFVNGVLRNLARRKDDLPYPEKGSDEYLSVRYACPEWLCRFWREQYGDTVCEALLDAVNRNPRITLRVNTLKTDREALMASLRALGIDCEPTPLSPDGILLSEYTPVTDVTPLAEGLCFVQDEASQLCAMALGAEKGHRVLDTCSCPGGKSFGIALAMQNEGALVSMDLHESKLSLVEKGAARLGITCLTTAVQNGTKPREDLKEAFDRVLCDVPCSGLGVIAKKPDLRHKSPDDIARLPAIQYAILENGAAYVKKGGALLYSTCTLNKEENEAVVKRFLTEHPEFEASTEGMPFGQAAVTLFPHEHNTDGFFMARFVKKQA